MKKSRHCALVVTFYVLSAFFLSEKAGAGSVWLMVDGAPSSAESGGVFETAMKFTTWQAVNGAYLVSLHYDPSVLQVLQVTTPPQSAFYGNTFADINSFTSGKTDITAFQVLNSSEQNSPETLAVVQWRTLGRAGTTATVQLETKAMIDSLWRPVDVNSAYPVSIGVIDTTPPPGEVSINNGSGYTNSISVTLGLSASDFGSGVSSMRFSNDGFNWSSWESYSISKVWGLLPGDGSKTVYAQFLDGVGNVSGSYFKTITLDTISPLPPTGLSIIPSVGEGIRVTWNRNLESDLEGYKLYSGTALGNYELLIDVGALVAYPLTSLSPNQTRYIAVKAYDASGNESDYSGEVVIKSFDDILPTHWAYGFIIALYDAGVTGGCSGNPPFYCPESSITRGEMAVFMLASLNETPATACTGLFMDADEASVGDTFCRFVEKFAELGITGGCGGEQFCPNTPVTRAQMAVFIEASLGRSPAASCTERFSDVNATTVGDLFCRYIEDFADQGITGGCSDNPPMFCPNDPVTRAQMAVFLVAAPSPLLP